MCLVPLITWLEDLLFLQHLSHTSIWIGVFEVCGNLYNNKIFLMHNHINLYIFLRNVYILYIIVGLVLVVIGLYVSSLQQEKITLDAARQLLTDSSEVLARQT